MLEEKLDFAVIGESEFGLYPDEYNHWFTRLSMTGHDSVRVRYLGSTRSGVEYTKKELGEHFPYLTEEQIEYAKSQKKGTNLYLILRSILKKIKTEKEIKTQAALLQLEGTDSPIRLAAYKG